MSSPPDEVWETGVVDPRPSLTDMFRQATFGLRDARTWRSAGYVVVEFFATLGLLVVALALLVPAVALCVIGVGFPLTLGALGVMRWLTGLHRRRARWLGVEIRPRPLADGSTMARFRDGNRWRSAVFALTAWFPATFAFIGVVVAWALPLYLLSIPLWAWALDTSWTVMMALPLLGVVVLVVAPIATRAVAQAFVRLIEWMLGPDRIAMMERRVSEVTENRDEILTAVAGERRRIERNLHDGVQQQLVALGIDLGLAETKLESDPEAARQLLADATKKTRESIGELRTIGRGLHPAILGDRGLDAALSAIVSNSSVPVELRSDLPSDPPEAIAEAAYFVVSEAMTNVMKHSRAKLAVVDVASSADRLTVSVYDDGRGGATLTGTGLAGIAARVRGLNGMFELSSPAGGPTVISVELPYS